MRTAPHSLLRGALALVGLSLAAAGCNPNTECLTNRQFFAQKVWGEVMSKQCIKCHSPEGVAAAMNAKLLLLTPSYPGFIDTDFATVQMVAHIQFDGVSELLLKPTGNLDHGGLKVIEKDGPEYQILQEMIARMGKADACAEPAGPTGDSLQLTTPLQTVRKAGLALVGRLPSAIEEAAVATGGEAAMDGVLDGMMKEEAFIGRVKEIYADLLLTNRYQGGALGLLDDNDYPGKYWWNPNKLPDNQLSDDQRKWRAASDLGVASEPIEIVAHVVRENRPFTEILSAQYTMVNAYSARIYGLDPMALGFSDSYGDQYTFREAKVSIDRMGMKIPLPHAGVLTTTVFLRRYPTTETNLNRARARQTFKLFLATDILKVAERPIDPSSVKSLTPTRDDPNCNVCHKIIDPVAATYQKWDGNARFQPDIMWPQFLPQPGFGQNKIDDVTKYPSASQWLAGQIIGDTRFTVSTVYTMYKGLTGQDPFTYPPDDAPDFTARLAAYQQQDATLRAVGEAFRADNYNLKTLVKSIVHSAAYRAVNGVGEAGALEGLGTGRFLTPELLDRKITAVTGVRWVHPWDKLPWLTWDYNLLYGGIDNDNVTTRLTDPNGVMSNVALRMASEVACYATAYDLVKPVGQRILFPEVEISHRPEDENGYPIPKAIEHIRANIRHLHERVLGETLADDDPEVERTYQLFVKTYRELLQSNNVDIPGDCRGRWDPVGWTYNNGASGLYVDQDKYFTVKSWMAVMAYMLSDYKFLYE